MTEKNETFSFMKLARMSFLMIRLSLCKGTKQFNEVGKNVFHAQSLQSCPILCDLMNCSMPGSSVHGISQERILEWVANPSAGDLLNPGLNPCLLHCQADPLLLSSVQTLSCVLLFATPWTAACQASLSIANFQSLLKLMSIESVMPSPTFSSSVTPFSSCLKYFLALVSFLMSQLFASGGQTIAVSVSAPVLPMNIQDFRID